MADFTVTSPLFPDEAEVGAYGALGYSSFPLSGPPGPVVATATVADSSVTFTDLTDDTPYFAAVEVEGAWRSVRFFVGSRSTPTEVVSRDPTVGTLETRRGDSITAGLSEAEVEKIAEEKGGLSEAEVEAIAEEKGGAAITATVEASGEATAYYDAETEEWEARPKGFRRVIYVSSVNGAPDPLDAEDFDEKVEPREEDEEEESVETKNIKDGAVTTEKLGHKAVTEQELGDGAVTTSKLFDGAVTNKKIEGHCISTDLVIAGAITEELLDDEAVTKAKLAKAVQEEIEAGGEAEGGEPSGPAGGDLTGEYPNPTIGAGKVHHEQIGTGSVQSSNIGEEAVESGQIKAAAVITTKIAKGAVTKEKLSAAVQEELEASGEGEGIPAVGCSVIKTESQSIANVTDVMVTWDSDSGARCYNDGCWSSAASTRFTATEDGLWSLSVSVCRDDEDDKDSEWSIRFCFGGSEEESVAVVNHDVENTNGRLIHLAEPAIRLNKDEFITVSAFQDSGTTRKIEADESGTGFQVARATFERIR